MSDEVKYVSAIFFRKLISSIVFEIDLLETNVCRRVMENNLHKKNVFWN